MTVIELIEKLQALVRGREQEIKVWCWNCQDDYGEEEHEVREISERNGVVWINYNA